METSKNQETLIRFGITQAMGIFSAFGSGLARRSSELTTVGFGQAQRTCIRMYWSGVTRQG